MSAIRLARGVTRRDRIIKFAGCYHGHADALLAEAGSGLATLGIPSTPGRAGRRRRRHDRRARTTTSTRSPTRSPRYGEGLAAILVEPVAGNMGVVPPEPGFLEALRQLCDATRRAARLRRGDHRLPRRARRRAGALRRPARPDDPRQDRRRRPAARGVRRARGRDGPARAGRPRLPGRHALREPARDRGRARRAAPAPRRRRLRASSSDAARGSRRGCARSAVVQRVGAMATLFATDGPVSPVRGRRARRHRPLRGALPRPARARHLRRAVAVRVHVRLARARRRRDRPHDRRPLQTSSAADLWDDARGGRGRREPALGRGAATGPPSASRSSRRSRRPSFALGLETIYEGYLVHYGRPRLFAPADADTALLLGDYLYAHGLVRIAARATSTRCATSPS